MARLVLGADVQLSIDGLRRHFALPAKRTPYQQFKGLHWAELDRATQQLIANGCADEVESIHVIFNKLAETFPLSEYAVVDLTVRMFTEPVLQADSALLAELAQREDTSKHDALVRLDISAADLHSSAAFVQLLAAEGVKVAVKNGKNGAIPALAKTDAFMRELIDHDNDRVRRLARARLGIKSTLQQTRAQTLRAMADRGPLPVYLRYYGAHTGRWSGGDKSNFQNLKRGSDLRRSILAPSGFVLATVDLSQIECRILNTLARQDDVIENFRSGHDPYLGIASKFYGRAITKADTAERGTGKQAELSCGYGCGWRRFQSVARLGLYGPAVTLSDQAAERAVKLYRETHPRVVKLWAAADDLFPWLAGKLTAPLWLDGLHIEDGKLYLPNGTWLNYQSLQWHDGGWRLQTRQGWQKLYGAKLIENIVQALARIILSDAGVRIARAGFRPVLSSHDEWSFLVPRDGQSPQALDFIMAEMKQPPSWLPNLPIDCTGSIGERYGQS